MGVLFNGDVPQVLFAAESLFLPLNQLHLVFLVGIAKAAGVGLPAEYLYAAVVFERDHWEGFLPHLVVADA